MRPYIGMTGFSSAAEIAPVVEYLETTSKLPELGYDVMFGFTCSNKRLEDPESEGKTSPKLRGLFKLTQQVSSAGYLPMIHYFTDKPANLRSELELLTGITCCANLQINQEFPLLRSIPPYYIRVVIQIPKSALAWNTAVIAETASDYGTVYLLIDPSGGAGQDFDLNTCGALIPALEQACPASVIGVAGGIGPENVEERYAQIFEITTRPFSIDAQGKLRTDDKLDPEKAIAYLAGAERAILRHGA